MTDRRSTADRPPQAPPPTPRWVKLSLAAALGLALMFVTLHVTGLVPSMQHGLHQP
jgi:hypothetical protein